MGGAGQGSGRGLSRKVTAGSHVEILQVPTKGLAKLIIYTFMYESFQQMFIECLGGNGNPLQYSCLQIPWTEEIL